MTRIVDMSQRDFALPGMATCGLFYCFKKGNMNISHQVIKGAKALLFVFILLVASRAGAQAPANFSSGRSIRSRRVDRRVDLHGPTARF